MCFGFKNCDEFICLMRSIILRILEICLKFKGGLYCRMICGYIKRSLIEFSIVFCLINSECFFNRI